MLRQQALGVLGLIVMARFTDSWISSSHFCIYQSKLAALDVSHHTSRPKSCHQAHIWDVEWNNNKFSYKDVDRGTQDQTLNWCANFVVPLDLCPWAPKSVEDDHAIHIYNFHDMMIADDDVGGSNYETINSLLLEVAERFWQDQQRDVHSAISFVTFQPRNTIGASRPQHWWNEFGLFFDWYVELEEESWDDSDITLAPFHPNWTYNSEDADDLVLDFEKQSPYPTISLVATSVIHKAGDAATKQIAINNELILRNNTIQSLQSLYQRALDGIQ